MELTKTNPEKLVYSARELVDVLGLSLPRVYELLKRSDFPSIRLSSRRIVVPCDALREWLNRASREA